MKLRYYLRGLGIGMVVTALLMGFATKDLRAMTDEEIMQRAKELGMVSGSQTLVVKETPLPTPEFTKEPLPTHTEEPISTPEMSPEPTAEPTPTIAPTPTPRTEPTKTPEATPEMTLVPEETEHKVLVIKSGESSVSVSKSLYEMGLVQSANEYDSYLCKNGFDKVISVGTYEIPADASYEDIAKIITRR